MDPTEIQEDKSNDAHSLEQSEGGAAPKAEAAGDNGDQPTTTPDGAVDATGGKNPLAPKQHKQSFVKKLWARFNIYLVLFVLVLFMAGGVLAFMLVKGKKNTVTTLNSQSLSDSTLKQLANTDVTVGKSNQILTVQSNAIFAGAVLARSSLDVAGSLKVGGNLNLSDLTVSGATQLGDAVTNNLTINGSLNLQGELTLKNGINVSGNSTFTGNVTTTQLTTGSLQLNGDLNLTHHITAGGTIPSIVKGTAVGGGGTASLSGSDTAGSITINTGNSPPAGCFATVTFSKAFSNTPHVVLTPIGSATAGLQYYVTRTTTNFIICSATAAPAGQTFGFDYIALD
ncbi:MAG TPA: hypothetical protein VKQ34_02445 [Candidatus Saccharimonadales bacterium]|nr:hypothetical protein [Candidatus Saccharimonadales bacterium]